MRMRVSTNRADWQMRGKSSAKAESDQQIVARNAAFTGFCATAFNHNQKLRTGSPTHYY